MTLLLLYFCLALGISFVCSLLEATMLSVSMAHVELLAQEGRTSGQLLRSMKGRIDQPLIAILTLNTVANTVGAAGVGAQTYVVFGNKWVAVASGVLTLCILVFSEVIPKTLGAAYCKQLAPPSAYVVKVMITLLLPIVWLLELVSKLVSRSAQLESVTREEVMIIAQIGRAEGAIGSNESRVIHNLLRLREVRVKDIMTPRRVIQSMARSATVREVAGELGALPFSRVPVHGKDLDDIPGFVFRYRVLEAAHKGEHDRTLGDLMVPLYAIPESAPVSGVLQEFIRRQEHLFLVVDEYGGTEGIVSFEDAIETLLGVEIMDETDSVQDMRKLALDLWERRKERHTRFESVRREEPPSETPPKTP